MDLEGQANGEGMSNELDAFVPDQKHKLRATIIGFIADIENSYQPGARFSNVDDDLIFHLNECLELLENPALIIPKGTNKFEMNQDIIDGWNERKRQGGKP